MQYLTYMPVVEYRMNHHFFELYEYQINMLKNYKNLIIMQYSTKHIHK